MGASLYSSTYKRSQIILKAAGLIRQRVDDMTPFGGVKDSGYGREGGTKGLNCYTVAKNVSHKMISS
jgi:hypothetical protein